MKVDINDTFNFKISHNKLRWILDKGIKIIDSLEKSQDKDTLWKEYLAHSELLMEKCKVDKESLKFSIILLKMIGGSFAYEELKKEEKQ